MSKRSSVPQAPRVVGRPDMAKALVAAGVVNNIDQSFKQFLGDGGPLDIPSARLELAEALELATNCGAKTSIAHPHVYGENTVRMICRQFAGRGLGAIEAYYGPYTPRQMKLWAAMAREFKLCITGGSDLHRPQDVKRMGVEFTSADADSLRRFLA